MNKLKLLSILLLSLFLLGNLYATPSPRFKSKSDIILGMTYFVKTYNYGYFSEIVSSENGVEFRAVENPKFQYGFDDYTFDQKTVQKIASYRKKYPKDPHYRLSRMEYELIRILDGERSFFLQMIHKPTITEISGYEIGGKPKEEKKRDKNKYVVLSFGVPGEGGSYSFWFLKDKQSEYRLVKFR